MTAARSYLALYAAPNTRGAGPRPPRLVLVALALFWACVLMLVTGCAPDPTRAVVGLGYGVDREPWEYAAAEWRRASGGRVALTIAHENTTDVDLSVGWELLIPASTCARTNLNESEIRLNALVSDLCAATTRTTALHELGHYMGAEHTADPRDVMHEHATDYGTETLTAADVAQVVAR